MTFSNNVSIVPLFILNPKIPVKKNLIKATIAFSVTCLTVPFVGAQSVWNGGDGSYNVAGNWTPSGVPDTANGTSATINSGTATYTPGADFTVAGGAALTINGGTWTQDTGIAWINVGNVSGGTINVNSGGAFNFGTAQNMRVGFNGGTGLVNVNGGTFDTNGSNFEVSATGTLQTSGSATVTANEIALNGAATFNGGTVNINNFGAGSVGYNLSVGGANVTLTGGGNFVTNDTSSFSVSSGSFATTGEFQPNTANGATVSLTGGNLDVGLIAIQGGETDSFNLDGTDLSIANGGTFEGVFSNGGYINVVDPSSSIFIDNLTVAGATGLFDSRIRYNGVADENLFNIVQDGSGVLITPTAVPEPQAFAMAFGVIMLGLAVIRRRR